MITNMSIRQFRGFRNLQLRDMTELTLISGKNNSGKSTILEAVFLFLDHAAVESFSKLNQFRCAYAGASATEIWTPYFHELDTNQNIEIDAKINHTRYQLVFSRDDQYIPSRNLAPGDVMSEFLSASKQNYSLRYEFYEFKDNTEHSENGNYMINQKGMLKEIKSNLEDNRLIALPGGYYINNTIIGNAQSLVDWMGKLELQNRKNELIEVLRLIEPELKDIVTVSLTGIAQLYAKIGNKLLPLRHSGDGINKLLYILLTIIENPETIILIDEIETGFHYSIYANLWKIIVETAKRYSCQVVATTHSYECIAGAVEGIAESYGDAFSFYRIENSNNRETAYRYSYAELSYAISSSMEVR